jgi:hypothetical protein
MYQLTSTPAILRTADNAFIPQDLGNQDYQQYLAWVAAGNTPTPYVAPSAPPLQLTPYQMRAALTQTGLRAQAEAFVTASTDQSVKDAWQYAGVFIENDAFVTAAATALGKTAADIHALFQLGQTLAP